MEKTIQETSLPPEVLKMARRIWQLESSGFREWKVRKQKHGGYAVATISREEDTSLLPDPALTIRSTPP